MFGWLFGGRKNQSSEYLAPGRLEDVISLIQILGLDPIVHRGDKAIKDELCDDPDSAKNWSEVARKQPEFFRVFDGKDGPSMSLIARHVVGKGDNAPALAAGYIHGLIEAAIRLHQGQIQRQQIKGLAQDITVFVTIIGGIIGLVQALLSYLK